MKLCLNTLELFNDLITQVELPKDFIHLFMKSCINQCRSNQDTKANKQRMVRLICVFLASIIKAKYINLNDVYMEIHSFCIDFSSIKEANGVLKLI